MKEIEWIKVSTNISRDEKIRALRGINKEFSWIWICLLSLAGKTNDNGWIYVTKDLPYSKRDLADYCGTTIVMITRALDAFTQYEMIEYDDGFVQIINWYKHQNGEALEKIREQTNERVRKHRAKKIGNVA